MTYSCINCTKPFKVMNEMLSHPADSPEVPLDVECPRCHTFHTITWPRSAKYAVTTADKP